MNLWARMVFAAGKKRAEGEARRDLLVNLVLQVGSVAFLWFTGGISALVATYVAAAVAAFTAGEIASIDVDDWDDEAAIQTVICCVADKFIDPNGTNFDQEVIRAYIDDCYTEFEFDSIEAAMCQVLTSSFASTDSWIAFTQL